MKYALACIFVFVLAGCQSMRTVQNDCEATNPRFEDMVSCLKRKVNSDSRSGNARAKIYLATADDLVHQVKTGRLSESQARLHLAEAYLRLKSDADAERARKRAAAEAETRALEEYRNRRPVPEASPSRQSVTAYFTGRSDPIITVTGQAAMRCEYDFAGTRFWRNFRDSCPPSVEVY